MERENTMLSKDKAFYKKEYERLTALNESFKLKNDLLLKKRQASENITETYGREDAEVAVKKKTKKRSPTKGPAASKKVQKNDKDKPTEPEENKKKEKPLRKEQKKGMVLSESESDGEDQGRLDTQVVSGIGGWLKVGDEIMVEVLFRPDQSTCFLKKPRLVPLSLLLQNQKTMRLAEEFIAIEYQNMLGIFEVCRREAECAEANTAEALGENKKIMEAILSNYVGENF
jgi:hypothetical protein